MEVINFQNLPECSKAFAAIASSKLTAGKAGTAKAQARSLRVNWAEADRLGEEQKLVIRDVAGHTN